MTSFGRLERILRVVGVTALVVFAAAAFTPLSNLAAQSFAVPARLESADAIVVLASDVYPDGILSPASLHRAVHGIELQRRNLAPLLVLSGSPPKPGADEAAVRANLARTMGVPPGAIVTVTGSRTTRDEAVQMRDLLAGRRTILLVTSSAHMPRAQRAFARQGFTVLPAPADDISSAGSTPGHRLRLSQKVLQELAARVYYRVAGYL